MIKKRRKLTAAEKAKIALEAVKENRTISEIAQLIYLYNYQTVPEVEQAIHDYFYFYNHERSHQSLTCIRVSRGVKVVVFQWFNKSLLSTIKMVEIGS